MVNRNLIGWSTMILSALAVPALAASGPISPWGRVADMKLARGYHTLTPLSGNRILAVGGMPMPPLDRMAEVYDVASNTWAFTSPAVYQHAQHQTVALLDGRVLVTGGIYAPNSVEVYDGGADTWTALPSMATGRHGHGMTVMSDGRVLVTGGWNDLVGRPVNAVEIFDPATSTWSRAAALHERRAWHTAALMEDGRVLVVGGSNGPSPLATVEIYDPRTDRWSAGPSMALARSKHGMVATARNGRTVFVVAGGCCVAGTGMALADAEYYDPAGRKGWLMAGKLSLARMEVGVVRMANGDVLLAGGENAEAFQNLVEALDVATLTWKVAGTIPDRAAELPLALLDDGRIIVSGGTMNDDFVLSSQATALYVP